MSGIVLILIAFLTAWMVACAVCGFKRRFVLFLGILLGGLVLNMAWMILGLDATPFEPHALYAQGSATLYALGAFGFGWMAGRVAREWRNSVVEDASARLTPR